MTEHVYAFGIFKLVPHRRLLLAAGQKVPLGDRAFDLLVALIKQAGQVISKGELTAAAWPDAAVEETTLRVHTAALRCALAKHDPTARFIVNVPGRG